MKLKVVPVSSILIENRSREDMGDIERLKASINSKKGLIQPIAVVELDEGSYRLLAGGRRMQAITELEIKEVPVRIYEKDSLSAIEMKEIEEEETIRRKDFTWQEAVKIQKEIHDMRVAEHGQRYRGIQNQTGWGTKETAELFNESETNLRKNLMLAEALEKAPELAKCKTKQEATQLLASVTRQATRANSANTALKKYMSMPKDSLQHLMSERYRLGDFFKKVSGIQDSTIDFIEVDPPYAIDLKNAKQSMSSATNLHSSNYNEIDASDYPEFLLNLLTECYRVLKEDRWLVMWFSPDPWFQVVANAIRDSGFTLRALPSLWTKPNGQTQNPAKYLASAYEMFFIAAKGNPVIYKPGRTNVFNYRPVEGTEKIHPTERPIDLIKEILITLAPTASTVLVPFLGSGNTLFAAQYLGMNALGYELDEHFRNAYITRLAKDEYLYGGLE